MATSVILFQRICACEANVMGPMIGIMFVSVAMAVSAVATDWLTVEQARQVVQCGLKLIYREIKAGRLRAARIGNRRDLRIKRDWIDQWLEASARPVEVA